MPVKESTVQLYVYLHKAIISQNAFYFYDVKFISVKMKLSMAYVLITWSFEDLYFQSFYFQYDCEILQSKPSVF